MAAGYLTLTLFEITAHSLVRDLQQRAGPRAAKSSARTSSRSPLASKHPNADFSASIVSCFAGLRPGACCFETVVCDWLNRWPSAHSSYCPLSQQQGELLGTAFIMFGWESRRHLSFQFIQVSAMSNILVQLIAVTDETHTSEHPCMIKDHVHRITHSNLTNRDL